MTRERPPAAQIHYFDIDLAPWETKEYPFASYFSALASGGFQFVWIAVEDKDSFEQSVPYDLELDAQRRLLKDPGGWLAAAHAVLYLPFLAKRRPFCPGIDQQRKSVHLGPGGI